MVRRIAFGVDARTEMDWSDWEEIDRILTGIKFGTLQEVSVSLITRWMITPKDFDIDAVHQLFVDHLPLLDARGVLRVEKP
jgi:hypothetical protein